MIRAPALHNAVVGKELRARMRGWRSVAVLTAYMAVLGIIAVAFLVQQMGPAANQSSQIGIQLFQALSIFQLFLIIFVTPASTAGAISGERQRQTWDLLLVTRLSALGIVCGKLIAGLAFDLLLVFASLPLFSLVFLFGGVSPDDVLHTYVVFLATVLLLGATSLFVSALTPRLAVSMIVSNIIALALGIGLSLLSVYLETYGQAPGPAAFQGPGPYTLHQPALTPLAQVDPLVALLSALPNGSGGTLLANLGIVHHAFGISHTMHLWETFAILSVFLTLLLLAATAFSVRLPPRWVTR